MPKKSNVSAFDELLEKFPETHREQFLELANVVPELKDSILRQADYSRNMTELQRQQQEMAAELEYASQLKRWEQENFIPDPEHPGKGWTKREKELEEALRLAEEQAVIPKGTVDEVDDVNIEELEARFLSKAKGEFQKEIAAKEAALLKHVDTTNGVTATAFATLPQLTLQHFQEFGEVLDPKPILTEAVAKNRFDVEAIYREQTAERRQQKLVSGYEAKEAQLKADYDAKLAAQQKEWDERAKKLEGMGAGSPTPSESQPSEMGAFQRQYLGMDGSKDGVRSNGVPDKARLGDGMIAQIAARNDFERAAGR